MKYLCLVYQERSRSERPAGPDRAGKKDYWAFAEDIKKSGHVSEHGLKHTDAATTVRVRNGQGLGPTTPLRRNQGTAGGYFLIEAKDPERRIQVAARIPRPVGVPSRSALFGASNARVGLPRESRRVLATLIPARRFDLAEEALQDAFAAAPSAGRSKAPGQPRSLAHSTGHSRRSNGCASAVAKVSDEVDVPQELTESEDYAVATTGCASSSPAATRPESDAQVAMTLREVCGPDDGAGRAAFSPPPTTAGAAHRAGEVEDPRRAHSYDVPEPAIFPSAWRRVLHVVYLVFNSGLFISPSRVRGDPAGAAAGRAAPEPEAIGLLALMLLHDARRATPRQRRASWSRSKSRIARSGSTPDKRGVAFGRAALYPVPQLGARRPPGPPFAAVPPEAPRQLPQIGLQVTR